MDKFWNFLPDNPDLQSRLSSKLGISDILTKLLVNRVESYDETDSFLNPQLKCLHDPFLLKGMTAAVALIRKAASQKKKFLIYGDYDVDGVSSTVLLLKFFQLLKIEVDYYIPNRVSEGYSFTKPGIEAVLKSGASLLISVDNGISAVDQVKVMRENGIDVIITDHHEPPEVLPPANVIIDPKQKDCPYPFKSLAGVGVAFKLAWGVAQEFSRSKERVNTELRGFLLDALAWVALGTVTDLVPMVEENRILAKSGIPAIHNSSNPGLLALSDMARNEAVHISAEDISFRIGPRINAAGRMGQVEKAVSLFCSTDEGEAKELAQTLDGLNRERQTIEKLIFSEALSRSRLIDDNAIVLADKAWHPGVIGIVASRLVEEFGKPSILIALDGNQGKGSCRSIHGLDIYKALTRCSDILDAYGGHALAGGFQIRKNRIDAFRDKILSIIAEDLSKSDLRTVLNVDAEIFLSSITRNLLSELDILRPFGEGNPLPIFVSSNLEVAAPPRIVGRNKSHLVFRVSQGGSEFKAIAFGMATAKERIERASSIAIAYTPRLNLFYGRTSIELQIKDIKTDK